MSISSDIKNELILITILILVGLPLLNYNFRIVIALVIIYLVIFPERREVLYKLINNQQNNTSISNQKELTVSFKDNILYNEGDELLKELKKYKNEGSSIYISIKISWKKFKKLSMLLLSNNTITYPHHIFSTLIDQRKYILNQMSAMIVNSEPINLRESTLTKDRTLPLDAHIRIIIRKMDLILNNILNKIKNKINSEWVENPYIEISPVEFNVPQAHNQNKLDIIL
jgi:hypothetical protein